MQVIDNKALLLTVRDPIKITSTIPKSKVVEEHDGVYRVLVHLGLEECQVLKNLGVKNVPSPIDYKYGWPGMYTPFEHQKTTASFLTLHRRAYCFSGCH